MFLTNNRSRYPKECKRSLFDVSEVVYHNLRFFPPHFLFHPHLLQTEGSCVRAGPARTKEQPPLGVHA